jgi:hypothetical protein
MLIYLSYKELLLWFYWLLQIALRLRMAIHPRICFNCLSIWAESAHSNRPSLSLVVRTVLQIRKKEKIEDNRFDFNCCALCRLTIRYLIFLSHLSFKAEFEAIIFKLHIYSLKMCILVDFSCNKDRKKKLYIFYIEEATSYCTFTLNLPNFW